MVGTGPERRPACTRLPRARAEFLGRVSDAELAQLYSRARALVLPNIEEFGIAAVEAQAAGRPVVAPAAGGPRRPWSMGRPASWSHLETPGTGRRAAHHGLSRLLVGGDPRARLRLLPRGVSGALQDGGGAGQWPRFTGTYS